ncbi:MAG TPA: MFS transporter, partial [Candidatus Dormibacteraeota bacterium]|nr:MFS transporter [Candidatus Dormibacteraeota bacterium]
IAAGINEAAATLFLLLIAVRAYEAGPLAKALVAGGGSVGLLLAPWLVRTVEQACWPVTKAASRLALLGAASFLVMAVVPTLPVFVGGCVVALATSSAAIPLMTQIYQENYPDRERGKLFSRTMMLRIGTTALFSDLAGRFLSGHLQSFRWLLVIFAAASALGAFCLERCPSRPLTASGGTHPFHAFRFLREDRIFRQTIISWVFLGFATLMMAPLRVEYLANPRYGVRIHAEVLTAGFIALITGVIPNVTRLILNPVWGWLFDRMNFFVLRITLNFGFVLGIVSFFTTGSLLGLIIGAILFGISNAGADVAWSLWVIKFAPPERVADYMSVHTFFTGIRGLAAPLTAFYLVAKLAPQTLGWISVGLIIVACSFLVPEIKFGKSRRPAAALVQEISE